MITTTYDTSSKSSLSRPRLRSTFEVDQRAEEDETLPLVVSNRSYEHCKPGNR
jgi:hypothetical protein